MGKRINEKFLSTYIELDKACCEKFGISAGGVTEYINRLNNARFAPGRDDALPRLVRYRNLRNRFAHEASAIRKTDEVSKEDDKWLLRFKKDVERKRDPISKYLKKARRYARRRRLRRYLITFFILALILAGVVTYLILTH